MGTASRHAETAARTGPAPRLLRFGCTGIGCPAIYPTDAAVCEGGPQRGQTQELQALREREGAKWQVAAPHARTHRAHPAGADRHGQARLAGPQPDGQECRPRAGEHHGQAPLHDGRNALGRPPLPRAHLALGQILRSGVLRHEEGRQRHLSHRGERDRHGPHPAAPRQLHGLHMDAAPRYAVLHPRWCARHGACHPRPRHGSRERGGRPPAKQEFHPSAHRGLHHLQQDNRGQEGKQRPAPPLRPRRPYAGLAQPLHRMALRPAHGYQSPVDLRRAVRLAERHHRGRQATPALLRPHAPQPPTLPQHNTRAHGRGDGSRGYAPERYGLHRRRTVLARRT